MSRVNERFIEQVGLNAEADGLSRIAGRLFGALLLSDTPRSLDDLAEQLGVSKASVSTDARRLLERGVVERVGRPGDRRDYYQLTRDFFVRIIAHRVNRWRALHELASEMRTTSPDQPPVVRERLDYLDAIHEHVLARIDEALAEWEHGPPRQRVRGRSQKARS